MIINLTNYFKQVDSTTICNSVANLGQNAAKITWENAKNSTEIVEWPSDYKKHLYNYFKEFGAWDHNELSEMCKNGGIKALALQEASAQYHEIDDYVFDCLNQEQLDKYVTMQDNQGKNVFEQNMYMYFDSENVLQIEIDFSH
jgi:hypothetical protein